VVATILVRALISRRASRSISAVIQQQQSIWERKLIMAKKEVPTLKAARRIERALKRKKNPALAIYHLQR
jgi:hypothetical protein